MNCLRCNRPLENTYICPYCGYEDQVAKKIIYSSNWHYNQGLAKAQIRDLTGAIGELTQALKYNKRNTDARNLLGLIYYHMGEVMTGLGEWVISVHFQQENNIASDYIAQIENDQDQLLHDNKIIRQYNQALNYALDDNEDMAIIELKQAVNMSPSYVKANQLLGLLYMKRGQYSAARKALSNAVKVDRNNITTLNYMKELNRLQGRTGRDRKKKEEKLEINDPTPIIIEENTDQEYDNYSTGFFSFINVLIGIVIGAAVIWLLVVPSVTRSKTTEYNQAVVEYSAQISDRNKTIDELQTELEELQITVAEYEANAEETVDDAGASEARLIEAVNEYLQENITDCGMILAEIDSSALVSSSERKIYDFLRDASVDSVIRTLYSDALECYENEDYLDALEGFIKVLRMDNTYSNAIYYMGRTYDQLGDAVNAASYYRRLLISYPGSAWAEDAQRYLDAMGDAVDDVEAAEIGDGRYDDEDGTDTSDNE